MEMRDNEVGSRMLYWIWIFGSCEDGVGGLGWSK